MQEAVVTHGADFGIALDGDADRAILACEKGKVVDGDLVMVLVVRWWLLEGRRQGGAVVATVMSNLGLERYLNDRGCGLVRTPVGDRYVVERMREGGYNVGGEQSGHIVLSDFATTGDGLIAALQVLAVVVQAGQPASEVTRLFDPLPQLLRNVRFNGGAPLEDAGVQAAIRDGESRLGTAGRRGVRKSGTGPPIRLMAGGGGGVVGGVGAGGPGGQRGGVGFLSVAVALGQRALQRLRAEGGGRGAVGDPRRRKPPGHGRPTGEPQVGHRAVHPRDGRGRGRGAGRPGGRGDLPEHRAVVGQAARGLRRPSILVLRGWRLNPSQKKSRSLTSRR